MGAGTDAWLADKQEIVRVGINNNSNYAIYAIDKSAYDTIVNPKWYYAVTNNTPFIFMFATSPIPETVYCGYMNSLDAGYSPTIITPNITYNNGYYNYGNIGMMPSNNIIFSVDYEDLGTVSSVSTAINAVRTNLLKITDAIITMPISRQSGHITIAVKSGGDYTSSISIDRMVLRP